MEDDQERLAAKN